MNYKRDGLTIDEIRFIFISMVNNYLLFMRRKIAIIIE